MTKFELQELIRQSSKNALSELASRVPNEIQDYADDNGTISTGSLASYCIITSQKLSNQILLDILSKALEIEE